jgi:NADP-dependent 3-hydroxy acid dehydrogenase YdfG
MASASSKIDAASLFSVPGLVAVITGGGSGLGAMMAHAFDTNGYIHNSMT